MKIQILIYFLFTYFSGVSQTQVFQDYDFESGDYSLYFIDTDLDIMRFNLDKNTLTEKYVSEHFYVFQTNKLISIKGNWSFKEVGYTYSCGSDYFAYITFNDSVISNIKINTECNEFILEGKSYRAPEGFLLKAIKEMTPLTSKTYRCDTQNECDSFILDMKKDENLVLKEYIKTQRIYDRVLSKYFIEVKLYFKHEK